MLTHKGTQTIETNRLILRKFRLDDAEAMFETWANDPRVTQFLTWEPHGTVENTKQVVEMWFNSYEDVRSYQWAIEYQGKILGSICVVAMNERSEWAEIGYCIGYNYWGKGIMTEAAQAVIEYLFREIGFNRIEIDHAVKNPGSGRVAQKCGLTYEGTKRQEFKSRSGEFLDIAIYGILKKDWEKNSTY